MTIDGLVLGAIMAASFWVGWLWRYLNGPKRSELNRLRWDNLAKAAEISVLRQGIPDPSQDRQR